MLGTFKNCKEVKQTTIMIIAIIYIFFILRDIWSKVENYFLKIVRPPLEKIHSPLKIQKVQGPVLFVKVENFPGTSAEGGDTV